MTIIFRKQIYQWLYEFITFFNRDKIVLNFYT